MLVGTNQKNIENEDPGSIEAVFGLFDDIVSLYSSLYLFNPIESK